VEKKELREPEEQIPGLKRKRGEIRGKTATSRAHRTGSEMKLPRPKVKVERESTRLPPTP